MYYILSSINLLFSCLVSIEEFVSLLFNAIAKELAYRPNLAEACEVNFDIRSRNVSALERQLSFYDTLLDTASSKLIHDQLLRALPFASATQYTND